jgi:hypothetical protein
MMMMMEISELNTVRFTEQTLSVKLLPRHYSRKKYVYIYLNSDSVL